jgi:hypothetical protein
MFSCSQRQVLSTRPPGSALVSLVPKSFSHSERKLPSFAPLSMKLHQLVLYSQRYRLPYEPR